jgi:CheY-like chemotaxis protein
MSAKRALIVDDSKSARVVLSRMLEKYDIEVDMAESAEQAIGYLGQHRPDAIFMDHLMPGMDGLQAVQAIKSNPQTATIPIMMYTSQEGELYVGQARALGAMGVLPKQVRPVDVSKVLYELRLLPDRRDFSEPALHPVDTADGASGLLSTTVVGATVAAARPAGADSGRRVEAAVKDQGVELRRFMVASLDSFATRIVSDVRAVLPPPAPLLEPAALPRPRRWPWWAALTAAGLAAVALAMFLSQAQSRLNATRRDLAALTAANAELKRSQSELADTVRDLTTALAHVEDSGAGFASAAAPSGVAAGAAIRPTRHWIGRGSTHCATY